MYNRILVAFDVAKPAVFESALSMAVATHANLLLLHVLSNHDVDSPTPPVAIAWDYAMPIAQSAWEHYEKRWQHYVDSGLEALRSYTERAEAAGVVAEHLQITNEPGRGICQVASTWQADLIVIGSHQRKGLQELLLGSVSNYVMHHAPCSVMVVSLKHDPINACLNQSEKERQNEPLDSSLDSSLRAA